MARQRKICSYPYCEQPEDMERGARMCTDHSLAWMRSAEFRAAATNPEMQARAAFGIKDAMKRLLNTHRKRWAKAAAERENPDG